MMCLCGQVEKRVDNGGGSSSSRSGESKKKESLEYTVTVTVHRQKYTSHQ